MDNSDIAAAALKPDHTGRCNCRDHTRDAKPNKGCKKCKGTGKVKACQECDGSGWNPHKNKICATCGGNGYL